MRHSHRLLVAVCIDYVARADLAEQVVAEIQAAGGRSLAIGADIADPAQVAILIARTTEQLGPITILVNNAGVVMSGTLEDYDHAAYQRMRHVNVDGLLFTTRAVVPGMREHRYGRIIKLTAVAGIGTAMKRHAFYSATKAEVIQFTKRFAMELGRDNITVNALAPGFMMTEMAREWPVPRPFWQRRNPAGLPGRCYVWTAAEWISSDRPDMG